MKQQITAIVLAITALTAAKATDANAVNIENNDNPIVAEDAMYRDPAINAGFSALARYKTVQEYADIAIEELEGYTIKRVIAEGDYLYILGLNDTEPKLLVYDHANMRVLRQLETSNCLNVGDSIISTLSDISITGDKVLLGMNKAMQKTKDNPLVTFYRWDNDENGIPTGNSIIWNSTSYAGNLSSGVAGETMTYIGTTTKGKILYTGANKDQTRYRIVNLDITDGLISGSGYMQYLKSASTGYFTVADYPDIRLSASPLSESTLIVECSGRASEEFNIVDGTNSYVTLVATHNSTVDNSCNHASYFRYGGRIYCAAPDIPTTENFGVKLLDITDGIDNATVVKTAATTLSGQSTSAEATVGTTVLTRDESGNITNARLALFLLRNNKISKFIPAENTSDEDRDDDRARYAYNLSSDYELANSHTLNYSLTGDAKSVQIVLTPTNSDYETVTIESDGLLEGQNTCKIPDDLLVPGVRYNWAVRVESYPIPFGGKFFHRAPSKLYSRGGVAIITDSESDSFGKMVVSTGYAQGFDLYNPDLSHQGNYLDKQAPWVATERASTFRLALRDGIAYACDLSNAGAGFWSFDPEHPENSTTNLFSGTNNGSGCFVYNGVELGGVSTSLAFIGSGDKEQLWSFQRSYPWDNIGSYGVLCRYDIAGADKITSEPVVPNAMIAGWNALFRSGSANIVPVDNGLFIAQVSDAVFNTTTLPGFIYIDLDGNILYNSGDHRDIIPSCGSGMAISADRSLLAISTALDGIRVYDVTWNDNTPSLSYLCFIDDSETDNNETSQMAFDPAGNLFAFRRSKTESYNGVSGFALRSNKPVTTTAARSNDTIFRAIVTGVENIGIDASHENADDQATYYTLQGIKVQGELRPGFYIKVQGKKTTKVYIE